MQAEQGIADGVCKLQRLRGNGRGWHELAADRVQWEYFAAHIAAQLQGAAARML